MYNHRLVPSVIALGMFDGMHIGHRAVINKAVSIAGEHAWQSVAYTFMNHPRSVFAEAPELLMDAEKKRATMMEMGIDVVDMVKFDKTIASMSPMEFIEDLANRYDIKVLVAGSDFTFGYKGQGTIETFREYAGVYGYEVCEVPFVMLAGEKVSSTRIRNALAHGEREVAEIMLGEMSAARQKPYCDGIAPVSS
ncbi:MAG: hypothetical protein Q4D04_07225 [Clostridia bacterium]|nr:hypothetical protein [Clostridia bacterium]